MTTASPYQILFLANLTERLNKADTDEEREYVEDYIALIRRLIEHRAIRLEKEDNRFSFDRESLNRDLNYIVFKELDRRAIERGYNA